MMTSAAPDLILADGRGALRRAGDALELSLPAPANPAWRITLTLFAPAFALVALWFAAIASMFAFDLVFGPYFLSPEDELGWAQVPIAAAMAVAGAWVAWTMAIAWVWCFHGRETVRVDADGLTLEQGPWPVSGRRDAPMAALGGLAVDRFGLSPLGPLSKDRGPFHRRQQGMIAIAAPPLGPLSPIRFGGALSEAEADRVVAVLSAAYPDLARLWGEEQLERMLGSADAETAASKG
ncbi:MAG: hypothetical protein AAFR16_08185 [Pseudomonadota bacterium]